MGPEPVVAAEPCGQGLPALVVCFKGTGIGPLTQRGLDEAVGLAVGLRCGRPGADVPDAKPPAGTDKSERSTATSVVSHNAIDVGAKRGEG